MKVVIFLHFVKQKFEDFYILLQKELCFEVQKK